ncbi:unnamed protein product [Trichogramma brassicae]|uniref:Uncharacterized protein n=1 Tax=Trichogramma brassicae TaxID=86971 RepID=A0A6H5IKM0_9HYME|nr:unnamed protein product [Trichogramma brassicae]
MESSLAARLSTLTSKLDDHRHRPVHLPRARACYGRKNGSALLFLNICCRTRIAKQPVRVRNRGSMKFRRSEGYSGECEGGDVECQEEAVASERIKWLRCLKIITILLVLGKSHGLLSRTATHANNTILITRRIRQIITFVAPAYTRSSCGIIVSPSYTYTERKRKRERERRGERDREATEYSCACALRVYVSNAGNGSRTQQQQQQQQQQQKRERIAGWSTAAVAAAASMGELVRSKCTLMDCIKEGKRGTKRYLASFSWWTYFGYGGHRRSQKIGNICRNWYNLRLLKARVPAPRPGQAPATVPPVLYTVVVDDDNDELMAQQNTNFITGS